MAFGPGHLSGTPLPGEAGNAVVTGHRDTHFAFLRRLRLGDVLEVERPDGRPGATRSARPASWTATTPGWPGTPATPG